MAEKYYIKNLQNFIKKYVNSPGAYNDRMEAALKESTEYNTLQDAINAYDDDLANNYLLNNLTGFDFLRDKCNIILTNSDNGSAIGSDAGSGVPRSRLDSFYSCTQTPMVIPTVSSEVIEGITFNYLSTGLNQDHLNVLGNLSSRWLPCAIDLINKTFGFNSSFTQRFSSIDIEFLNDGISQSADIRDQVVARAQITYDVAGNATGAKIILNRNYLDSQYITFDEYCTYRVNTDMTVVSAVVKCMAKIMLGMYCPYTYLWQDFFMNGMVDSVVGIDREYDDLFMTYFDNYNYVVWGFSNLNQLSLNSTDAAAHEKMIHPLGVSFLRYLFYNPEGYDALVKATNYGQTINGTRYKVGHANTYKEIFENFLEFATGEPDDLVKWDLIDNRLEGFHGATIRCPMPEAQTPLSQKNKAEADYVKQIILVTTDEFTCPLLDQNNNSNKLSDALENRIKVNVNIAQVTAQKFSDMFPTYNQMLDQMIDDMNNSTTYSTDIYSLVFTGLERDLYLQTKPIAELLDDVMTLTKKCVKLGIIPVLIIHPSIYSYVGAATNTQEFIQDVEILVNHPWDIEEGHGLKVVDGYSIMRGLLNTKRFSWDDCNAYTCSTFNHFNYDFVSVLATDIDNSMGKLGSKYLEPCFFISMCYFDVDEDTFTNFKDHPSRYMTGAVNNWNAIVRGNTRYLRSVAGAASLFDTTGEICQVMLHTTFDKHLWACEQGGCTCKHFADYPVDHEAGFCKTYARIQTQTRVGSTKYGQAIWRNVGKPQMKWEPQVVFPGTGTPWFCISTENKETFFTDTNGFTYYFTRTNYTATITIRVKGTELIDDVWQSMSFGCMDTTHLDQYKFPLYVAGGSQATSCAIHWYKRQDADDSYDTDIGLVYDLDMTNILFTNSNLLTPCEANGNGYTNFRVMSPEGVWKSIVAMNQEFSAHAIRQCAPPNRIQSYEIELKASDINDYEDVFGEEYRKAVETYADARPTIIGAEVGKHAAMGIGCYRQVTGRFDKNGEWVNLLFSIMPYLNPEIDYEETGVLGISGVLGVINDTFGVYDENLKQGVYKINDKHYLIIPDGWVGRLLGYKHYWPLVQLDKSAYDFKEFFERYYKASKFDLFYGRVAIRLD